jgi:hypothetical protein
MTRETLRRKGGVTVIGYRALQRLQAKSRN